MPSPTDSSPQALQEIVCCMGQPVAGNPTQFMMERAFAAAGLDWRYLTLEVAAEQLPDAVRGLRSMSFRGGNFTIPHKVAVILLLDALSPAAELMGAVNCVKREGNQLLGENTDGKGFVESLRTVRDAAGAMLDPAGKRFAILGSGGAARAIAVELGLSSAAEIVIVNRTVGRGQDLVTLLNDRVKVNSRLVHWRGDYEVPAEIDVLINATSIGLGDAQARVPVDINSLRSEIVVADVIFNPPRTRLIRDAEQRGCRTLDGLGMLVNQAVIGFKIWTGVAADANVMREALEEFLNL